jgi:hypothetical protein
MTAEAHTHYTQGIALYDPQQYRSSVFLHGQDSGVLCRSYVAWSFWFLGYPDQGLAWNEEAVTLAQQSAHPFSLSFALAHTEEVNADTGDMSSKDKWFRAYAVAIILIASCSRCPTRAVPGAGWRGDGLAIVTMRVKTCNRWPMASVDLASRASGERDGCGNS